jgi:hypothetical protein
MNLQGDVAPPEEMKERRVVPWPTRDRESRRPGLVFHGSSGRTGAQLTLLHD